MRSRERDKSNKDIIKCIAAYLSLSQFVFASTPGGILNSPQQRLSPAPRPVFLLAGILSFDAGCLAGVTWGLEAESKTTSILLP